jgi:membrane-bound lytic murein transglycosylase B
MYVRYVNCGITAGIFFFILAVFLSLGFANAETLEEKEARLQAELVRIEQEIQQQQVLLNQKSSERRTLERDVSVLEAEIRKTQLAIQRQNLLISDIQGDITTREAAIRSLDEKMDRERSSLAQLIRRTNEIDDLSFAEMILGNEDLSTVFTDLDSFEVLKSALSNSFETIAQTRRAIERQRNALEQRYGEEQEIRELQVLEKQQVEEREAEKANILAVTKGQEAAYQTLIKEREKTAAQIRAALFSLRDTADISFGEAYEFAKQASVATGVRPAFLLGILKTESDLGKNVGQCLLTNSPNKGDGIGKNTGRYFSGVMKGTRDVDPFMIITADLGINASSQVVSCPQSAGYGGAMGPAQFIPSTWIVYKDRIAAAAGENPPNPWNPRTAFFASALYMEDLGADRGTLEDENRAARKYYAGSNFNTSRAYDYSYIVLGHAEEFQRQIDILEE